VKGIVDWQLGTETSDQRRVMSRENKLFVEAARKGSGAREAKRAREPPTPTRDVAWRPPQGSTSVRAVCAESAEQTG